MKIVCTNGNDELARVYVADMGSGKYIEFVESVQPPIPREEKWVLILSTLYGCPVGCGMCDAGGDYKGPLSTEEMRSQIDHMITSRYPGAIDGELIPIPKLKLQFSRMGEPALNPAVLDVLDEIPFRYNAPGFLPCVSTVAPAGSNGFFPRLLNIKDKHYPHGMFQLQFSIHSTDQAVRDQIIPIKKWSFEKISEYGERFKENGDRKITLNFALAKDTPVDPSILLQHFSPDTFLLKITPLNPTYRMRENRMESYIDPNRGEGYSLVNELRDLGYEVIVSIGEVEENKIGSNCGQYIQRYLSSRQELDGAYRISQ